MDLFYGIARALFVASATLFLTACNEMVADESMAEVVVPEGHKTIVVGAGCFWCVEAFYEKQPGVVEAISGYAGGTTEDPKYKQVAYGLTDQVETVKVIYDPEKTNLRALIDFFWTTHDVTRGDGVWPDFGPHYRSILLPADAEEKAIIEASLAAHEEAKGVKVATEVKLLHKFYPAEEYHQDYAVNNPRHRYIVNILNPKLKKLGLE